MSSSGIANIINTVSFIAILDRDYRRTPMLVEEDDAGKSSRLFRNIDDRGIEIYIYPRIGNAKESDLISRDQFTLLIGDDSEYVQCSKGFMAHAVAVDVSRVQKTLQLRSSIVGLPPVYIYTSPKKVIITTDLYLLKKIHGLSLRLDILGLDDIRSIGHPVDHRTLFKGIELMPCGHYLRLSYDNGIEIRREWQLPDQIPLANWDDYIRLQSEAFKKSIHDMNLNGTRLSLTGGLDTRAILAVLVQQNRLIPAFTMSGITPTLDAITSGDLCRAYDIEYRAINLREDFYRDLPEYGKQAALLSGGVAGLEQAAEVYYYKEITEFMTARLSGNLGNQLGRGGTEKTAMRNVDQSILSEELRHSINKNRSHWYDAALNDKSEINFAFLVEQEIPFSHVSNYNIGNHYAVQKTPYANISLIENYMQVPVKADDRKAASIFKMRLKDLKHRFLGESISSSFQRNIIFKTGGYLAQCPINWGWRPAGGISLYGAILGLGAFADAVIYSKQADSKTLDAAAKLLSIHGLHEYRRVKEWIRFRLKDFMFDTLSNQSVKVSGIFNNIILNQYLAEHYSKKRDHYNELLFALEMAVACEIFNVSLSE